MLIALIISLIGGIVYISSINKPSANVLGAVSSFSELTPSQFDQAIKSKQFKLIDVRTIDEYNSGHIKGATENDFYQTQAFSNYLSKLDKDGKYLIYCHTGRRSGLTLGTMQQMGFKTVYDLGGGYAAWTAAGLPTEK